MADGDKKGERADERPDAGKVAREAGVEIGEAVSRAAEAAGTAIIRVGQLAGDALLGYFGNALRPGAPLATDVLPELPPLLPVKAGDEVATRVKLVNSSAQASDPLVLSASDLVSQSGDRIAADAVVVPEHERVVAGGAWDTVGVTLKVPPDAKPGVYEGELKPSSDGIEAVPLVVEVR
jgi:hypothetical protein